jgi:hypothetical protein
MVNQDNKMFAISEARGLAAVSFDASRGLFTNNPALLLIFAGIPVWLRLFRGPVLRLALVIGPTILLQATFVDWGGAYAPAARYPLQFVPAAIPAIALLLREARVAGRLIALAVLGFQWAMAVAFLWLHPAWSIGGQRSTFFTRLDHHHWPPLDHLMPSFDSYTALIHHGWRLAAWVLVAALLLAYGSGLSWRLGRGLTAERAAAH